MRNEEVDRLRVEEDRELAGLRKAERRMATEEKELERELQHLDADIEAAEETVDVYLRAENGGHDPDHPAYWHKRKRQ
jgi:hypothetical protein